VERLSLYLQAIYERAPVGALRAMCDSGSRQDNIYIRIKNMKGLLTIIHSLSAATTGDLGLVWRDKTNDNTSFSVKDICYKDISLLLYTSHSKSMLLYTSYCMPTVCHSVVVTVNVDTCKYGLTRNW